MAENLYTIGNPPAGIYSGDINVGYAFYHVLLDVHARDIKSRRGLDVRCPRYSLNVFGKKAESLSDAKDDNDFKNEIDNYVNSWIDLNRSRDRLNLSFQGTIIDNSSESVDEAQRTFVKLQERGYLINRDRSYFLDLEKIAKEIDLKQGLDRLNFYPSRSKGEFLRFI